LTVGADATKTVFTNIEVLATSANTADFKASQLSGQTFAVKGFDGTDTLDINDAGAVDIATIDLSGLKFDSNLTGVNILGTALADTIGLGTALNITGSSVIDTINLSTQTGANVVSGGAGADVITGGTGNDTITGGEGADTIVTTSGTDTINLAETTAAADSVTIGTTAAVAAKAVINGFDFGGTATDDNLIFDVSSLEEIAGGDLVDGAGTSVGAAALSIKTVTAAATDIGAAADELIVIDGNYATAAALQTALETGGAMELVFGAFGSAKDSVLISYDNGVDTFIALLTSSAVIADGAKAAAGTLTVTNVVTLAGVADCKSVVADDFGSFIA
jgi:hypothetical protein